MKYDAARLELKRILNEQQTVSVPKLSKLLQIMDISLNGKSNKEGISELDYLKKVLKLRNMDIKAYQAKVGNQKNEINALAERLRGMEVKQQ